MTRAAVLSGLGTALPPRLVTNDELSLRLNTSDEWIRSRTGIGQRYWTDRMATSDLAVDAGRRALKAADTDLVDLVVLATTTPDHPCPATAPDVAARLGLGPVAAFDVAAVCSGFVYGLATAAAHVEARLAERALVIGAETFSTILDPGDRSTSIIFGDGAGAVILRAGHDDEPGALLESDLGSDGSLKELIRIPGGGSRQRTTSADSDLASGHLTMDGRAVFRHAVMRMAESARTLLARTGWGPASVDCFVAHQANVRILHAVADQLGIDRDRTVVDLDRVGNTSAASIPLALSRAAETGRLMPGHRVLLSAFGAGATWGSIALTWPDITAD
ncbi:beta-ketoacyl-ACP synthase III [Actinoallomurus purpureus]|uniref:beta-ketoacyl-ACP synthase III n=1 Tax=Actinoallomurus purpureus TaxID=478114 RepID=UPI0025AFF909|nr:beta-ketoacyl-ACP synthase III [Actinoallomurus purpureus]